MLKQIDIKQDNMTSCYFIGGDFLGYVNTYFKQLGFDVDVFIETPSGIMMSLFVYMDSKYDSIMLKLYNKYVEGHLPVKDVYPEVDRKRILNDSWLRFLMDEDIVSCKVIG